MKLNTNKLIFTLFSTFLLLFASCQKEENEDLFYNQKKSEAKVTFKTFEELTQDKQFNTSFEKGLKYKFGANKASNLTSRTIAENEYGFTIVNQEASIVEKDSTISYTLLIEKSIKETPFTISNLVIQTNKITQKTKAVILDYVSNSIIFDLENFQGQIKSQPIDYLKLLSNNTRLVITCTTYEFFQCDNHSEPGMEGCWATPTYQTVCTGYDDGSLDSGSLSTNPVLNNSETIFENLGITREEFYWINAQSSALKSVIGTYGPESQPMLFEAVGFLRENTVAYTAINNYLNSNNTVEDKVFIKEMIDYCITNPQPIYDITNYPGEIDGMPFEWWKNSDYIKNNLKIASINNSLGQTPNAREVVLFALFPLQAIIHVKNSNIAVNTSIDLVNNGTYTHIHNGKADAFRHAFWNAYDTTQIGSFVTNAFTTAHEWNSGNHPLETQMDFYNNQIGRDLGATMSSYSTADYVRDEIIIAIYNGQLKYIAPLDSNDEILINSIIKFTNQ